MQYWKTSPELRYLFPERFDPTSKYYLTPKGEKRPNYAFSPFLGGMRICLGKSFIEIISKFVGPTIISNFDFDFFTDDQRLYKKPNHLIVTKTS